MPLDISCFQISANINDCGTDIKMGDYKRVGVCLPYSDIIKSSIVYDGCKVNFSALPGAFAIYDKSNVPFNGSIVSEEMGARFMKYNELVVFPAFEHTPENAYAIYKMMQGGERFIVILEQEKPNATGTNRFQVFGMESGLKFKEGKSDKENQAANVITLEQINTGRPATYLFDTSDAITIAKVDTFLTFDIIYGGTIATGGYCKLLIDTDKTGYVKMPNGALRTTIAGSSEGTNTGVGGAVTYYVPKILNGVIVGQSNLSGNVVYNGTAPIYLLACFIHGANCPNSVQIDIANTPCFDLIAPKAVVISANAASLAAKSIGDILYAAYVEDRVAVNYTFTGGLNAAFGIAFAYTVSVSNYLLETYGIAIADVMTLLVTTNGGTILYND